MSLRVQFNNAATRALAGTSLPNVIAKPSRPLQKPRWSVLSNDGTQLNKRTRET